MPKIKIEGVPFANGSYDFSPPFTNGELRLIKREANVRAGEIEEAIQAGDTDLLVAFALIALRRAGSMVPADALWDAEAGDISIEDDEDDADPPSITDSDASGNANGSSGTTVSSDVGELSPES